VHWRTNAHTRARTHTHTRARTHTHTEKVIYSGAIEPILTYGAPIWEKALTKQNNLRKYQRVEYQNSQGIQNTVL
jgi:hypothetical protein